jgi:DNA-binding transcriptional MocR family regulator
MAEFVPPIQCQGRTDLEQPVLAERRAFLQAALDQRRSALKLGVRVANLDQYRCSDQPRQGLVLGYGNLADHQIDEGVTLLATATLGHRSAPGIAATST